MTVTPSSSLSLPELAKQTRQAARHLATLSIEQRNRALEAVAQALETARPAIEAANQEDRTAAEAENIPPALYARLKLEGSKLTGAIAGVRDVANLADPIGQVQIQRRIDEGLVLKRIACPVGVLGIIFEARPDAVIQIASLAIKSGNGAIMKGGREAVRSCKAIVGAIQTGLRNAEIDPAAIQLLTSRSEITELLKLDRDVDLIIPRGSNAFVRYVQDNTRIPVLGHADGICHLYLDASADIEQATRITFDSKHQYPAACNAIETLLVHRDLLNGQLTPILQELHNAGVELRADPSVTAAYKDQFPLLPTSPEDWTTEYGDLILAIKTVDSLEEAIAHINHYGSHHTDGIVTDTVAVAEQFLAQVNSAGCYHNCSTRFADGFRYGFGAEVGISTQKLPPRGPVGLEGLVTYKYQLVGNGHIAATYVGDHAKPFLHEDFR